MYNEELLLNMAVLLRVFSHPESSLVIHKLQFVHKESFEKIGIDNIDITAQDPELIKMASETPCKRPGVSGVNLQMLQLTIAEILKKNSCNRK